VFFSYNNKVIADGLATAKSTNQKLNSKKIILDKSRWEETCLTLEDKC